MNKTVLTVSIIIIILGVAGIWYASQKMGSQPKPTPLPTPTANPNVFDIQGMKVEILQQGSGDQAKAGDSVTVNYVGTLENGTKFDSSIDRGQPFSFTLGAGQVIKGWDLGVVGMRVGEKRRLTIPPELGYGATGAGNGVIPPNSTLIFEVDLLGINVSQGK